MFRDMPEQTQSLASRAAVPFVYPLDEFYARAGLALPLVERIPGDEMPEPFKSLLVHDRDMTPTLENFHADQIHLRILNREQRGDFYFRQVALQLNSNQRPIEFGANKLNLALFPAKARQLILEEHVPLGSILKDCELGHSTMAKAFFRITPDALISSVLGLSSHEPLYGRKATIMDSQKRPLSEVVEILPPVAAPAAA